MSLTFGLEFQGQQVPKCPRESNGVDIWGKRAARGAKLILNVSRTWHRRECKSSKPITPAILRQQRSVEKLRRFDRAMICGYGLLASILVLHLAFGGALTRHMGDLAVASSLPAKMVAVSWTASGPAHIHRVSQAGGI
jgi:hypothetical protein